MLLNVPDVLIDLDMVYADFVSINQTISALRNRAVAINSTLLSLQVATDNFTIGCSADIICEESVPMIPFLYDLDVVSGGNYRGES